MLLPATPGWVSLLAVVGGPRHSSLRVRGAVPCHSWLGSAGGSGVWWGCGWCVVWLAEVPVCYSPPLLAGSRCQEWRAAPRHSWLGPAGCGGVFRGWRCPLLCVFVVCVGVRGGRAVLCVACLWCLRCWWCGVVVRWGCLPRVLVCVVACVWCAGGLRFGVPAPCLSWLLVPFSLVLVCVCALCGPSCWCGWRGGGHARCGCRACACVCLRCVVGGVCHTLVGSRCRSSAWFKKQRKRSCRRVAELRGMRDAWYVPLLLSHRVFFPCRERACAGLLGGWLVVFACCALCLLLFFFSVASSITDLFALRFPYREGVEGAFVFSFLRNILVIPCAASCCCPL